MIVPFVSTVCANAAQIVLQTVHQSQSKQNSEVDKGNLSKKWNVTASCVNGEMRYRLYRYLDDKCNDREFYPRIWDSLQQAQNFADYLN